MFGNSKTSIDTQYTFKQIYVHRHTMLNVVVKVYEQTYILSLLYQKTANALDECPSHITPKSPLFRVNQGKLSSI